MKLTTESCLRHQHEDESEQHEDEDAHEVPVANGSADVFDGVSHGDKIAQERQRIPGAAPGTGPGRVKDVQP